ncbi:MAG: exodeoxyribonuclease VII small subunit [Saprospiraceae bacterium]|jgi:exodeoxyribonuclease VII small subunit|nr:exodeoxyribonuclease VII small subunit [Saprospiraceae bacterium]
MKEKSITYDHAYTELHQILSDLQQSETSVEELTQKIKRASELISFCKTKLRNTEKEIQKLLQEPND